MLKNLSSLPKSFIIVHLPTLNPALNRYWLMLEKYWPVASNLGQNFINRDILIILWLHVVVFTMGLSVPYKANAF